MEIFYSFCMKKIALNYKEAFSDASGITMASCYRAVLLYLLVARDSVMYVDVLKCKHFIIFKCLIFNPFCCETPFRVKLSLQNHNMLTNRLVMPGQRTKVIYLVAQKR